MAQYTELNKFLEDWNSSKLAGPVQHQQWMSTLRDDQRELAGELQSKSLDQLVEDNNISDYINLYKIHPTYDYRINNPNSRAFDVVMAGYPMEMELIGGNTGLQGNFLDWKEALLFEHGFRKQNGNTDSYEEAYEWAAENADPITYEEFAAVRPLIDFNSNGVSFNSVADEHNTTFRAAEESESDPIVWDGASSQDVLDISGTVSQVDRGTYEQAAESLGLSLEEFLAQYDYTGDGKINVGDAQSVMKYEQGTQTQPPGYDSDNFTALPEPEPIDSDGDGVPDENDAFPNDATETVDTDGDGVGDNAQAAAEQAAAEQAAAEQAAAEQAAAEQAAADAAAEQAAAEQAAADAAAEQAAADAANAQTRYEENSAAAAERDYDQRHALVFDLDGDGKIDALTDGLMYLRYLFGLRGDDMAQGAISREAARTAEEIQAYLEDPRVRKMLDFDRSGVMATKDGVEMNDALTDGLIGLRYGFGLSGETLTSGAATRDSEYFEDEQAFAENINRLMRAAFVLDDDGNITDELVFNAAALNDSGRATGIKADAEIDDNVRYDYENLDTPIAGDGQTPEPEPVDSDGDGVIDENDAFPNDATETVDTDGDGVGDNADAFPNDASETVDTDSDGVGNNADAFPNDASETVDTDSDGVGNNADAFPNDATETVDTDSDGVGNNADYDPTNSLIKTFDDWNASPEGDLDDDGVANNVDFNPDDPAITEAPQFEEGTDVGWPEVMKGDAGGFNFNNGMVTAGKTFYQGYSTPLTVDQIIDGYLSIKETGTWTDPRYAKYLEERAAYAGAGAQIPDNITNIGLETVDINNPGGAMASAEQFLREFSTGEFYFEGQRGGDPQIVDINYGRNPDEEGEGEFITLEDLFNARMPIVEGVGRPDAPLAPEFVDGVDTLPSLEELGNFYYDIVITSGYDYADAYMNALPEEVTELWDGRNKLPSLQDNPQFTGSLLTSIGLGDLLEVGDLTKLDPTKIQDWVYTIEDDSSKANAQSIHDAVKKYQDDPSTLSYEDRHFLHVFKLMEPLFYGTGVSDLEPLDLADDTLLDQISDLKTHQDIMSSWTNRVEAFPYVEEAVQFQYRDEEAPEDDPYWKPSTYGVSQLSIMGGGLTFSGTSGLAYRIDGSPVDPNMGIPYHESLYVTYGSNWLRDLPGKDMPLYQETDTLGASADMFDTYATLQGKLTEEQLNEIARVVSNNADYRALSPAIPVLEYLRKDGDKIAKEVGAMGGASKEEILEYFELQNSIKGYKLNFGGTELWYDPTKLYMKTPQDDNPEYFPTRFNQEGQVSNQMWVLDSYDKGYSPFEGEMPTYFGDFANPREENEGNGWLVDITGGNAPVGSYSMVWVAQPEYQDSWDRVLNDPFFNLFVSIVVPYGSIALATLKHLNGQTLKTEDWIGVVIDGLKLSGNLKLPATPEEATTAAAESGEAARDLAEAEAIADGFTGQTVISMGQFAYDAAYSAEYVTMLEGIGIAGLSAKQSVTLIRAMGSGDNLGTVLLGSFGDEYVTKALGGLGFDTSNISPEIMDSVTNIATDMLDDKSFEEAIASEAGGLLVDYFEGQFDTLEASPRLKQFLETVKSELKDATDAVGSIASNLGESLDPLYDAVKDIITEEDIKGLVDGSKSILNSFEFITEGISGIATGIEKEMLDPLTDVFKQGLTKFTTMASIDLELTGDLDADLDNFFGGVGNASKSTYDNLGESLKEVFKESVGQQIVTGEISNDDLYKIFSRELVAIDAISQLDPDPGVVRNIVDAIGPQVLTSALRNTLNAAMAGGETDKVFLDTIAQSAVNALRTAHDAGGLAGVTEAFNDFGTKITGTYGEVKDAAKAYNDLDNQLTDLLKRRKALADDLATAKQEKQDLEAAALAEGATIADIDAYTEYAENYVGAVNVIDTEIKAVDGAMDDLEVAYTTAKNAYDNSVGKLTAETQNLDSAVQLQYDDLYIKVIQGINPDIKLGEYAAANNLPEGSTASDVAKHYLRVGAKEGLPVTREEAAARQMSAISSFAIGVFDKAGIDISALNNSDRAKVLNKLTEDANKAIEEEGISAVEYLENAVKSLETDAVSDIEAYVASALSSDPDNPASIAQINEALNVRNSYMGVSSIYEQNGLDASQISNDMLEQIARGEVSYTVEYDADTNQSKIVWGDDTPGTNGNWEQTEWDADEQRFVTYQYNSVSSTRVEVNAEGNVVGDREEFTPVDTTIDYFAEKNPTAYLAFLERADNNIALMAENRRIGEDAYTRAPIYAVENYEDIENIPDAFMPGDTAAGRKAMRKLQAESDALVEQLDELNALTPNVPSEDLQAHNNAIEAIQADLELADRKVHRTAQMLRVTSGAGQTINNTWLAAKLVGTEFAPLAAKLFSPAWLSMQDAESFMENIEGIDFSMSNELSETLDAMDALGNAYISDVYKSDLDAIQKRWEEADGFVESVQAVFGSFADYPATFATEYIALELIEEALPLAVGGLYGKAASKATISKMSAQEIADLSPQIVNNIFTDKAIKGALATDLTMAFGGAVEQTYQEAYDNAMATGRYTEEEAQATAALMSLKAGTYAVSIIGMIPGSNLALDKAVLKGTTADAVTDHAKRLTDEIVDFGKVVTKETISEVLEETGVVAINELAYYNMGYDGETLSLLTGEPLAARDVGGNLGNAAAVSAIASAGTTSSILGIKKTVDALTIDTSNPLTYVAVTQNTEIASAIEDAKNTGNMAPLTELLTAVGIASMPLATEIYNIVDDQAHVTQYEAEQSFDRLGVEPTEDMVATAMTLDDTALDDDLAYTLATEFDMTDTANSTGRTTAQHYDIIQHIQNMANGVVPLDSSFNQNGDNMVDQADVDAYIAKLPRYEREQYQNYDATAHQDTGIVQELGGSLMTIDELNTLKDNINTLMNRGVSPTKEEIVALLMNDPAITGLPGQIEAAVNTAFAKKENKEAFAAEVITQMITDETIKTISQDSVKEVMGDPDGLTDEEKGIFGVVEGLKDMLDLGESDAETLAEYISDAVGTAGTFKDGVYQDDGTGLLGDLTKQGVLQDVAIAEITSILGSEEAGTGLYAIANDASNSAAAVARIESEYGTLDTDYTALKNLYDTAITNLQTNLGSPDGNPDVVGNQPTGLYALVGKAITAGDNATGAVETILGDYVDFAAFETALGITIDGKIDEIEGLFGTPPVYQLNDDGTIKRDENNVPLLEAGGEPTGYQLALYNAMQLQGVDRDLAIETLQVDLNQKITDLQDFTTNATAEKIKTEILDVYFPAKPDNFDTGRTLAVEEDYVRGLVASGEYDARVDYNDDQEISVVEWRANRTPAQVAAQDAYNTWADNTTGITPALENLSIETGTNFALLNQRVDAVQTNVTDYIRTNVLNVIGKPATLGEPAEGIFLAIEQGDDAVLDVLGSIGEDGSGVLRSLELLGLSVGDIKTFLDTNVGDPEAKTGIFGVVDANKTLLDGLSEQVTEFNTAITKQITDLGTDLSKKIADNEAAGLARDEATQKAVEDLATELGTTESDLLTALGTTQAALELGITNLGTDLSKKIADNEAAGLARDEATKKAVEDLATALGTTESDLLTALGTTQAALELGITNLGTDLSKKIADNEAAGLARDEATQKAVEDLATALGTTESDLLTALGTTQAALELGITNLGTDLSKKIADNEAAGLARDEATQQAVEDLATALGTTESDLLTALGTTQAALELGITNLGTDLSKKIADNEAAGLARDEATQKAVEDLATALGTTESDLLTALGTTQAALELGITNLGTDLSKKIADNEAAGLARDEATQKAVEDLATALGTTESDLLTALGTTQAALELGITNLGTDLSKKIADNEAAGLARDEATQKAVEDLATALGTTESDLLTALGTTQAALELGITNLGTDLSKKIADNEAAGLARDEATQQAVEDLATALGTTESDLLTALGTTQAALELGITNLGTDLSKKIADNEAAGLARDEATQKAVEDLATALGTTESDLLTALGTTQAALELGITNLGTDLSKKIADNEAAGLARDEATQKAVEDLATALGTTESDLLTALGTTQAALELGITNLGTDLSKKIADNEAAGLARDEATQKAVEDLATALGTTESDLLTALGTTQAALELGITNLGTDLSKKIADNEAAGLARDEATQKAVEDLATALGTTESDLLTALGTTQAALELGITNLGTDLSKKIADNEAAGLARDEATQKAVEDLATALGTTESDLLTALGTTQAALELGITNLGTDLSKKIADNEAAGLARDEATQKAVEDLATALGTTESDLLTALGTTQAALELGITNLGTDLSKKIADNEAAGLARDEATQKAVEDLATALGTTESDLLTALGTTQAALELGITNLGTDLSKKIADNEAAGLARDEATQKAVEDLATALGTTESDLLTALGTTQAALELGITNLGTDLSKKIADNEAAGLARDEATQQAVEDLATALGTTESDLLTALGTTQAALELGITNLGTDLSKKIADNEAAGLARDEATQQAVEDLATALGTTESDLLTALGTTQAALELGITNLGTELSKKIADNEAAGLARDEATQKAVEDLATALGTTESGLLETLGTTQAALEKSITDLGSALIDKIDTNEAAGLSRDEATQQAITDLATELGTTESDILTKLGTTQEGLEGKIADLETALQEDIGEVSTAVSTLETSLLAKIADNEAAGLSRDEATQQAIEDLATELGTTESDILTKLGTTQEGLEGKIADLETALQEDIGEVSTAVSTLETSLLAKIADNEAAGLSRDEATQQAIEDLATELGTTESDILTKLGTTQEGLEGKIADLETALQEDIGEVSTAVSTLETSLLAKIADNEAAGLSRDEATQQAIEDLATELGTTESDILTQLGTTQAALELGITNLGTDLSKKIADNEAAGLARDEATQQAVTDLAGELDLTEAALLEEIGTTREQLSGEITTATEGLATAEQVEGVQETVNQIADFMGIPANEVTQQDMDAFATVIADFEMDAEIVAQQDMLRYDVNADGVIDTTDQDILEAGLEGDYSGFAPDAQFNQATGMFLERQQDQQRIAELEQERIAQEAEFEAQREADRDAQIARDAQLRTDLQADFQEDLDERKEAEERDEFMKAFTAPGRTRTTTTPQDPADIRYFYDIAGDDIFANQQQDEFYGAASPFGDNFMNEILTPQRKKAKGGLIDETDEILKILGE
jgi:hypothetical protein